MQQGAGSREQQGAGGAGSEHNNMNLMYDASAAVCAVAFVELDTCMAHDSFIAYCS